MIRWWLGIISLVLLFGLSGIIFRLQVGLPKATAQASDSDTDAYKIYKEMEQSGVTLDSANAEKLLEAAKSLANDSQGSIIPSSNSTGVNEKVSSVVNPSDPSIIEISKTATEPMSPPAKEAQVIKTLPNISPAQVGKEKPTESTPKEAASSTLQTSQQLVPSSENKTDIKEKNTVLKSDLSTTEEIIDGEIGIDPTEFKIRTDVYSYDPTGLRDPFRPYKDYRIVPKDKGVKESKRIGMIPNFNDLEPLQRIELERLNLVGIVWAVKNPRAIVREDGGKIHTIQMNTKIGRNNGVVVAIREGEVVILETLEENGVQSKHYRVMELKN